MQVCAILRLALPLVTRSRLPGIDSATLPVPDSDPLPGPKEQMAFLLCLEEIKDLGKQIKNGLVAEDAEHNKAVATSKARMANLLGVSFGA